MARFGPRASCVRSVSGLVADGRREHAAGAPRWAFFDQPCPTNDPAGDARSAADRWRIKKRPTAILRRPWAKFSREAGLAGLDLTAAVDVHRHLPAVLLGLGGPARFILILADVLDVGVALLLQLLLHLRLIGDPGRGARPGGAAGLQSGVARG